VIRKFRERERAQQVAVRDRKRGMERSIEYRRRIAEEEEARRMRSLRGSIGWGAAMRGRKGEAVRMLQRVGRQLNRDLASTCLLMWRVHLKQSRAGLALAAAHLIDASESKEAQRRSDHNRIAKMRRAEASLSRRVSAVLRFQEVFSSRVELTGRERMSWLVYSWRRAACATREDTVRLLRQRKASAQSRREAAAQASLPLLHRVEREKHGIQQRQRDRGKRRSDIREAISMVVSSVLTEDGSLPRNGGSVRDSGVEVHAAGEGVREELERIDQLQQAEMVRLRTERIAARERANEEAMRAKRLRLRARQVLDRGSGGTGAAEALSVAVASGDVDSVVALRRAHGPVCLSEEDSSGRTPLIWACREGSLELVTRLVALNARVDQETARGETPLLAASRQGHGSCVQALLRGKAYVGQASHHGKHALVEAARSEKGHKAISVLSRRLREEDGVSEREHGGFLAEALLAAVAARRHEAVKELLYEKASVGVTDPMSPGGSLLGVCARQGEGPILKTLLLAKASLASSGPGGGALLQAALSGEGSVVEALVRLKAWVDGEDERGLTPLVVACREGHPDVVEALLRNGAVVGIETASGGIALHAAAEGGHCKVLRMLYEANADLDIVATRGVQAGTTAAIRAAAHAETNAIDILANCRANLNYVSAQGDTALSVAMASSRYDVIDRLLARGAVMAPAWS